MNDDDTDTEAAIAEGREMDHEDLACHYGCALTNWHATITERDEALVEVARLREALAKIDAIRNSIVGTQTVNWSAHVYPMIVALDGAGFPGIGFAAARADAKELIEQRDKEQRALEDLRVRTFTVLDMLAANGCDCECACDNNHNDDCERCLACRVAKALAGLEEKP